MSTSRTVSLWRIGPLVSSALMVVVVSLFLLGVVDGVLFRSATNLGHGGATVRVVAIWAGDQEGPGQLTAALVDFAAAHHVSIAFARGNATGLVTVLDQGGRFESGGQRLAAGLAAPGSGSTAVVSDSLGPRAVAAGLAVPEGVRITGTFTSDVQFDEQYPTHLFNVDAAPFGSGNYLFATADAERVDPAFIEAVVGVLGAQGMDVVDAMPLRGASTRAWLQDALASPYGVVILMFAGVVGLGLVLVLLLHAAMERERTVVEGMLGATRRQLRRLVARRLLVQVGPGIGAGGVVALIVLLSTQELASARLPAQFGAVASALAISLVTASLMSWGVGWREARKVSHVVPC